MEKKICEKEEEKEENKKESDGWGKWKTRID